MVLNRREIRLSRRVRGESLHAVRVRVAFSDTLSAANFFFKSLVIGKYKQGCITCTRALTRKTAATNIDSIVWLSTMDGDLPR